MVAVRHSYEAVESPFASPSVAAARADVDRLSAGLSKALLSAGPDVVRELAKRAEDSGAAASRRAARVGDRPVLDESAAAEVMEAVAAYDAACTRRARLLDDNLSLLGFGNAAGLAALGLAGALLLAGFDPMHVAVGASVVGAGTGPFAAGAIFANRCSAATRQVAAARARWAAALDAAGVATMGALAARRVAVAAWERRRQEAELAQEAARRHQRAWARMAGPGIDPAGVEDLLDRVEAVRTAQLVLFACLVSQVRDNGGAVCASEEPPEPVLSVAPNPSPEASPEPVEPALVEPQPTWLVEALSRLRGRRLRIWRES